MADVTPILINQLASQTTLQDTDYFIVGGDDAKKITVAQMKEALGINSLNTKKIEVGSFSFGSLSGKLKYQNGYGAVTIDLSKQGYKALGVIGYTISSSYLAPSIVSFDSNTQKASITARHVGDNNASGEVSVYVAVLYIQTT